MNSCIVLGYFENSSPFCMYSTSSMLNYFCLEDMDTLFFKNRLNEKSLFLRQLFKANPHHFLKSNDGRTLVLTLTAVHIARFFNCFHIAELCKLTVEEILSRAADPLLQCIEYVPWSMIVPSCHKINQTSDINFSPFDENEWLSDLPKFLKSKVQVESQSAVKRKTKDNRPIPMLHRWLLVDINHHCIKPNTFQILKSVEKTKVHQQAIVKTRQNLKKPYLPPSPPVDCSSNEKRKKDAYTWHKRAKLSLPTAALDRNLHLLASQATQIRKYSLTQSMNKNPRQTIRLPSIQSMMLPIENIDSCV